MSSIVPNIVFQSIANLSAAMDARDLDAVAVTRAFLERIDGIGRPLNCFVAVASDTALAAAAASAARAKAGRRLGPLDGIPIALKDNIDVAGFPSSNGFGGVNSPAAADAEVVRRLKAAGAVILGKLNMQEGALGAVNDNAHFGRTTNPWRDGHTPGGSSGGSGAAVAAGLCAAALGTDTGGSVRIPASYCGVVGLKPSFGLVSTRGVAPLAQKLDHVGPLTRSAGDARLMLEVMAGFDARCTESRRGPAGGGLSPSTSRSGLAGVRVGVIANFDNEKIQPDVAAGFAAALEKLRRLGAEIVRLDLPFFDSIAARRAAFVAVEVGAALAYGDLYAREPERFSPEMRGYLDWGRKASALQLLKADRIMEATAFALARAFEQADVIASPATPQVAFPFDAKVPDNQGAFCVAANMAGCPAISVPMGLDARGLPMGLQLMAPVFAEQRLLQVAEAYEGAAGLFSAPPAPYGPK